MQSCDIMIGKKIILENINFNLEKGNFIHLRGKNGSGKTVFMQSLLGFNKVSSGLRISDYEQDKICYIPDTSFFTENESVKDVLSASAFFYKTDISHLLDILEHLQFDKSVQFNQKISSLSKGTKKKLELMPLFLDGMNLFFLDEITTGLDTDSLIIICARLKELQALGSTIILTEHNQHIVDYLYTIIPNIKEVTCVNRKIIHE